MKTESRISRICPLCGQTYTRPPAISRVDDKTPICPDCGILQALSVLGTDEQEQLEILELIHQLSDDTEA